MQFFLSVTDITLNKSFAVFLYIICDTERLTKKQPVDNDDDHQNVEPGNFFIVDNILILTFAHESMLKVLLTCANIYARLKL